MGTAKMLRVSTMVLLAALLGMQAGELRADQKPRVTVGEAEFTVHGAPPGELSAQTIIGAQRVFRGHAGSVYSVAFSPDGSQALSGSGDNALRLWDVESGETLRVFRRHGDYVRSVAFSPDGRWALSGSSDNTLRLWDVASGRELRVFRGHRGAVYSVAFSPDGRWTLSGSSDNTLRLWDVASGREQHVLRGHEGSMLSVAFSPDGRQALSGSSDNTFRLWDVASGETLRVFRGHGDYVWSVAFSPDGRRALSGSGDKTLRLWDVASGRSLRVFEGHEDAVGSVAFSPDGGWALSGSSDNTLRLWDVASGKELRVFKGHEDAVGSVAFSQDGRQALSGSKDKTLRLWNIFTEPPLGHLNRNQIRQAIKRETAEELRRLQNERVGPAISRPQFLPRQVLRQDPFESKGMFEERVARADAEWNRKATEIQERYRVEVNVRNARVERFRENIREHQRKAHSRALAEIQGHPILTVMEDEAGRPKYDPEQEHLHLAFRFEHALETEDWVFRVPAGEPVRALYRAIEKGSVSASTEYRVHEDFVALVSVTAHHGNQAYRGKPALEDFNAPERRSVEIGVNADGLPDLEQQNPDLDWEIPKTVHSRFSDDIPGLLSETRAAPVDNRKWLFVIGIGDYSDTDDINYSRRTAEAFAKVAQKTLGISEKRTVKLLDEKATSGRIDSLLSLMLGDIGEGDTIYFYYSGHGIPVPEQDGAAFILPQDVHPDIIQEKEEFQVDRIYRRLIDTKASSVIAFMDSCFTGVTDGRSVFKGDKAATRLAPKIFEPDSTGKLAVLTAGTEKQYSNGYKEKGHRLFSYFVMKALLQGHQNVRSLYTQVYDEVSETTIDLGGSVRRVRQDPVLQGNPDLDL